MWGKGKIEFVCIAGFVRRYKRGIKRKSRKKPRFNYYKKKDPRKAKGR